MRRKVHRALIQLLFFIAILSLTLFLNRPQFSSAPNIFAWTKVRYRTTATKLPEARDICPSLSERTKPALVVSRVSSDGDPSWLSDMLSTRYHICIYNVDSPIDTTSVHLQVPMNRGHEAMVYLTFLIDNYNAFPSSGAVFVHGSRWAWHNDAKDYDNVALLAALDIPRALTPSGYHNLRCDWSTSTCDPSAPAQGSLEMRMQAALEPWSARAASEIALPLALDALFGWWGLRLGESGGRIRLGRTEAVRAQCCAQFVVSRERVWQHEHLLVRTDW